MPVRRCTIGEPPVLCTVLEGRVTDDELVEYYRALPRTAAGNPWREVVDGTGVTDVAFTTVGEARLVYLFRDDLDQLRDGRVAMVATSPALLGLFRTWQMARDSAPYEVQIFDDLEAAVRWTEGDVVDGARGEAVP